MMAYIYGLASISLLTSAIINKQKTIKALKTAWNLFVKILPLLIVTLILVSVVLYFLPDYVIAKYLGTSDVFVGVIIASVVGAISLLPGFITFPLSGLLLSQGVSYTVLAAFTTSLMMVGVVTFPLEKKYFGTKLAIVRNLVSFAIAIIVSIGIGIIYGEVF
ncbi:MAG: permease [Clostridiales bacterium]|nr:permease [Clostridiales bacterium]